MKVIAHLMAVALALVLNWPEAHADSVLERRYTSDKLNKLWSGTLGSAVPDAARFAMLAPTAATPPAVSDAASDGFGLPFEGTIVGEASTTGGTPSLHSFPVIPLSADDASVLNRRLAWSEIYLVRYRYFAPVSTDNAAILDALLQQQNAALLEAYLIKARLYYAASDLQQKCVHLNRLSELAASFSAPTFEVKVPDGWQPLLPLAAAAKARLGGDRLAKLACAVEPVRGRGETRKIVETRVKESVIREVRAKVDDTLTLLKESSTRFQALVNGMNVPIDSAEVMELERVLGNASANMVLVKEDQLEAAKTIATLKAVDLSSLNQPAALKEFDQGAERMGAMIAVVDGTMGALAELAGISSDPAIVQELAPCARLRGAYAALDLSQSTDVLAHAINEPYEDCIGKAAAVVDRFQKPSLLKVQMAELARRVRQISEIYLSMVTP